MTANLWRWEVDPFFAAAEDVQESADRLESAYRTWIHAARMLTAAPIDPETFAEIDFQRRHLITTLGIAKWQVEEFERAVTRAAAGGHVDDDASARHRQFIEAINYKIYMFEKDMVDAASELEIRPTFVLNLKDDDKDVFAKFLSGTNLPEKLAATHIESMNYFVRVQCKDERADASCKDGSEDASYLSRDTPHSVPSMPTSSSSSTERVEVEIRNINAFALCENTGFEANDVDCWTINAAGKTGDTSVDILFERAEVPYTKYTYDRIIEDDKTGCIFERKNGRQRSVSVNNGLNRWKVQAFPSNIEDTKSKRRNSANSNLTLWTLFRKMKRPIGNGFKTWKDGGTDLKGSQRCSNLDGVLNDMELGECDCWLKDKNLSDGYALGPTMVGKEQHSHWGLRQSRGSVSSSGSIRLTPLIFVALGFVGLLSLHTTSSI